MKKDLIDRELAITMLEEHLKRIIEGGADLQQFTKDIYTLSRRHAIDVLRIVPPAEQASSGGRENK